MASTNVARTSNPQAGTGIRPYFFVWGGLFASLVSLVGGLIDITGHINYQLSDYDSPFTPWHAVFYAGLAALMIVWLGGTGVNFVRDYHPWTKNGSPGFLARMFNSVPKGAQLGLLGGLLVMLGTVGDITWHSLFGFETGIETIASPSHILLISGLVVSAMGPLSYAWLNWERRLSVGRMVAVATGIATTLSWLWYFTNDGHPLVNARFIMLPEIRSADQPFATWQVVIVSFFFASAVFVAVALPVARRFRLLPGTFAFVGTVSGFFLSVVQRDVHLVPYVAIGGALIDALYAWMGSNLSTTRKVLTFSFFAPTLLWLGLMVGILLTSGTWLRIHGILGFPLLGGFAGLIVGAAAVMTADAQHQD